MTPLCLPLDFVPAAFGLRPRIDWASRDSFAVLASELHCEGNRRVARPCYAVLASELSCVAGLSAHSCHSGG